MSTEIVMTQTILDEFNKKIDTNTQYTISELKKILGEVYKEVVSKATKATKKTRKAHDDNEPEKIKKPRMKRERDENGEIIKKRAPSAYNLFIKEKAAILKADNPDVDPKAIFKMAIDLWKQQKEQNLVDSD